MAEQEYQPVDRQPTTVKGDIENVLWDARDLVGENFFLAQGYAQSAFAMANTALMDLWKTGKEIALLDPVIVTPLDIPDAEQTVTLEDLITATQPTRPVWTFNPPPDPTEPIFVGVPPFEKGSFPDFTGTPPTLDIPTLPNVPVFDPPPPIPVVTDPIIPTKPVYTMPDEPGLILPTIPDVPTPTFPIFDAEPPDANDLIAPDPLISDGGSDFELIVGLKEKIEDMIKGDRPAFTVEVETAMLNRELESALQIQNDTIDRISAEWSRRRAPLPNGVFVAAIEETELNFSNKRLDTNRDILLKNFELTQANVHKGIDGGVQLQQIYMNIADAIARRVFEASKAAADAMIASFNALVKKYEILTDIYKTRASVYEITIRAEIGKLEVYKTQMEGAKLTIDMNDARVKIYMAQLSGIEALIGLYRSEMEGAKVFLDIQRSKLEAFKNQIDAYVARINAKTAEYNMYRAKIDGEGAKAEIYSKQVEAFRSETLAIVSEYDSENERSKTIAENNKVLAAQYSSKIDGFRALIQKETLRIEELGKEYFSDVEIYKANVSGAAAWSDVEVKIYDSNLQRLISEANLKIEAKRVEVKNYEVEAALKVESMKGVAQIASSLSIGALSAIHVSAGVDAKGQASEGIDYKSSRDENYNYNFDMPVPE